MTSHRKILCIDLESCPDLQEVLKIFPSLSQYPGLTLKATINTVICFGYKMLGVHEKAKCLNVWDFTDNINDDYLLCKAINEIVNEADAVVTHNGKRFDWKFLQTRMLKHGLPPMTNIPHIDTCSLAKSNLFAFNNKLNTIAGLVDGDQKLEHTGWKLWVDTHNGDKKARELMTKYCKQDVDLLHKVYNKLLPFAKNVPNANLFKNEAGGNEVCSRCGSTRLTNNGYRYTQTMKYKRLKCLDCGGSERTDIRGLLPRSI